MRSTEALARYRRGVGRVASSTGRQLLDRPADHCKQIARYWVFMDECQRIPERYPAEIWPQMSETCATVRLDMTHDFEIPIGERAVLDGIVRLLRPKVVFEFGTFTGATTVLLADAAPSSAVIHTIDLPPEQFPAGGFDGWLCSEMIGQAFTANPNYNDKIVPHRADLRDFDFTPYHGGVDLVLVDAAHDYDSVMHDSRKAFQLLAPGGCIVWDDYHPTHWDSVRALNDIARDHALSHITPTRLVVLSPES